MQLAAEQHVVFGSCGPQLCESHRPELSGLAKMRQNAHFRVQAHAHCLLQLR